MKKISVLIVDDISETRESIRRLLQFESDIKVIGEAGSGSEAIRLAEELHPDIVLMDINMPEMDGIRATELLTLRVPASAVIIMSVQGEQAYLRRAMMAGAREYIIKPFTSDELAGAIAKVHEIEERKRQALGASAQAAAPVSQPRSGRVLSFFSTKGGVGKTTLAVNLAVSLAATGKWRVLLVDLNLQFGDVAVFLNLTPKRTIADITQASSLNYAEIQSCLLTHSSGLQVLTAPTRPEYAELVSAEHIDKILTEVKPHFDFIICDNISRFEDISLVSFDAAEQIWLVVSTDIPTLKNTKLSLEVLDGLHHSDKVRLILNRSGKEMGLDMQDVEKALNFRVSYEIPSDGRNLVAAVNQGVPFVSGHPGSKAAEGIRKMVEELTLPRPAQDIAKFSPQQPSLWHYFRGIGKVFGF
ncbi:MAG: response regulator [Desulfitobacteriaceae bacterium]